MTMNTFQTGKHTETPWLTDIANYGKGRFEIQAPGKRVSVVDNHEDAAFIVQAVNAHDALVTMLNRVLRYLEHPDVTAIPFAVRSDVVAEQVRAALKLTEEQNYDNR